MSESQNNGECPMAKRARLDEGGGANGQSNNEEMLKEKLKEFHVLDEIDGDDDLSENEGEL